MKTWQVGTSDLELFRNRLRLSKEIKIVGTAGLGISAGHIEAAKRVRAHHGACAFAIEVEIAYMKGLARPVELLPAA